MADRSGEVPPERPGRPEAVATEGALTVESARALAIRYNPILTQARAVRDGATANVEIADAGFYPSVQTNYGFQAFSSQVGFVGLRGRFPVLPVRGFGPGAQDFHVAEAQLKWTIFQFGKQLAKHDQAVIREEIAALQLERTRQTVCYQVGQDYFRVLEAKTAVEIAEKALLRAEAFAKESSDLLKRGVITAEEHLRTEARLAAVKQDLTDARSEREVAVASLNRAIGIDVNAPTQVAERREAPRFALSLRESLDLAVANRREIPVVTRGISVASKDVDIARAEFLPTVSVQAGYSNVTGTGVQNANVGAGGIFVTHDFFAGGKRRGQLRAADATVRSAVAQAQQVCDGIAFEVNTAYHGVEDDHERIETARASNEQAAENLRLVTSRFRNGDATPAELIEARAAESRAEQIYNASFYQYQRALVRLEFAVGAALPLSPGEAPIEMAVQPGPATPPGPPVSGSPFRPRDRGLPAFPGLTPGSEPPRSIPPVPTPTPTPLPPTSRPPSSPGSSLFGPPDLSRPPYESTSPYGNRP
jgi:outer membrane protein